MSFWSKLKAVLGVAEVVADVAVKNPEKRKILEKVEQVVDPVVEAKAVREEQKKEAGK